MGLPKGAPSRKPLIPGGSKGVGGRIGQQIHTAAGKTSLIFVGLIVLFGWTFLCLDIYASWIGWGRWLAEYMAFVPEMIRVPSAVLASALPMAVQSFWVTCWIADGEYRKLAKDPMFLGLAIAMFIADTAFDVYSVMSEGATLWMALIAVIGFFFFGSEVAISYFTPVAQAIWAEVRGGKSSSRSGSVRRSSGSSRPDGATRSMARPESPTTSLPRNN